MKFVETKLPGVIRVEPDVYPDARGFFLESYNQEKYIPYIGEVFVQDNHSLSGKDILRGLHAQHPQSQGKLVRVIRGEVFDVAVDIRAGSPNFGQWHAENLSAENYSQLYVPPGYAHGFCVLSELAEVEYKCTESYYPEHEMVIAWNDPQIGIEWPVTTPVLSARDQQGQSLESLLQQGRLPVYGQ